VRIEPMGAADLAGAAALVAGHELFARYGLTPSGLAARLYAALVNGDGLLVARLAGVAAPAGFVWFLERGTFYHSGYVRLLVVGRGYTGLGIGSRLMDAAEAHIFRAAPDVFLLVNTENHGAQRFYEARGYRRVGRLDGYAAPGLDEYVYRKRRPVGFSAPDVVPEHRPAR